ncbi:MAG TPA: hypothetical protein VHO49_20485, partial [Anaerolineales bacterium]|nr:hypothetical protein [Anaerolineales bacterium]
EGECDLFMIILLPAQIKIAPPPIALACPAVLFCGVNWGRLGRGSNDVMKDIGSVIRAIIQAMDPAQHL